MQKIMAANWKMYKTREEAQSTARELCALLPAGIDRKVLIFPPFTCITCVAEAVAGSPVAVGGQNMYPAAEGAFTGEISPRMLVDAKAQWVLVGHSERRHIFGEGLDFIVKKVQSALENGLKVLLCVGETLQEREEGRLEAVLAEQLDTVLSLLAGSITAENFAVAYEPVWAIGTGKVAGPAEIADAHAVVRKLMQAKLSNTAANIAILYGGSVKPENANTIINVPNVDGVLVGGASLKADSFAKIVTA